MSITTPLRPADSGTLLDQVTGLVPRFRERAARTEVDRTVPRESIDDLLDAGLARLMVPRDQGGLDGRIRDMVELTAAVAYGCPSTGWLAGLMIAGPHIVRLMSPSCQTAVWGDNPDVVLAISVMPVGRAECVDGGYQVNGEHAFCSGVNNAEWTFVGGMVSNPDGPPEWRLFLLPKHQYRIEDVWHTAGMRGTGSNTIVVDDVFVPTDRTISLADAREGTGPGWVPGDHKHPLPWAGYSVLTFTATMLGATESAYDTARAQLAGKVGPSGARVADSQLVQMQLGITAAKIATARRLLLAMADRADSDAPYTMEERTTSGRDNAYAAALLGEAVDTVLELSGTSAFSEVSPLQQIWRDVHFALSHISVNKAEGFGRYGRLSLGVAETSLGGIY